MRSLSKSKILAYRQCPKRLWLELHRADRRDDSGSETAFRIGNEIGAVARLIYDESGNGVFLDLRNLAMRRPLPAAPLSCTRGAVPSLRPD